MSWWRLDLLNQSRDDILIKTLGGNFVFRLLNPPNIALNGLETPIIAFGRLEILLGLDEPPDPLPGIDGETCRTKAFKSIAPLINFGNQIWCAVLTDCRR